MTLRLLFRAGVGGTRPIFTVNDSPLFSQIYPRKKSTFIQREKLFLWKLNLILKTQLTRSSWSAGLQVQVDTSVLFVLWRVSVDSTGKGPSSLSCIDTPLFRAHCCPQTPPSHGGRTVQSDSTRNSKSARSYWSSCSHVALQLASHLFLVEFGTSLYIDSSMLAHTKSREKKHLLSK